MMQPILRIIFAACLLASLAKDIVAEEVEDNGNCLIVSDVKRGTRCNSPTSIEMMYTNTCRANLRGYLYIEKSDGRSAKLPTGLLKPGDHYVAYNCSGTGNYRVAYRLGINPIYPNDESHDRADIRQCASHQMRIDYVNLAGRPQAACITPPPRLISFSGNSVKTVQAGPCKNGVATLSWLDPDTHKYRTDQVCVPNRHVQFQKNE
jgi:hypothetical protein